MTNVISNQLRGKAEIIAGRNSAQGWKKENLLEWKAADLIDQLLPAVDTSGTGADHPATVFSFSSLMRQLKGMSQRYSGTDAAAAEQAALLLSRKLEFEPDSMLCRECGCSHYDPCQDEDLNTCGWAEQGLCTACSGNSEERT